MSYELLQASMSGLPHGDLRYIESVGSTNDYAKHWADQGAAHLSLVMAGEQTSGRGRMGRSWHTSKGGALAFSLVLRPDQPGHISISRFTGLGALAVCTALRENYGLGALVKWPNDVIIGNMKLAGVLGEAIWIGESLQAIILGVGINVALDSVPPEGELDFPATSVEAELKSSLNRWELMRNVMEAFFTWLPSVDQEQFIQAWQGQLAYRDEMVLVNKDGVQPIEGRLHGLGADGSLLLVLSSGKEMVFPAGEVRMRAVDR